MSSAFGVIVINTVQTNKVTDTLHRGAETEDYVSHGCKYIR